MSALVQVLNSFCTARTHTDRDVLHGPGECPDVVFMTGRGNAGHCMLRILPGPQDSPFGAQAEMPERGIGPRGRTQPLQHHG